MSGGDLEWLTKLWPIERPDSEAAVRRVEAQLGHQLPRLLRQIYLQTSLRHSEVVHLQELDNLGLSPGGLVFAFDQQATMFWAIALDKLADADPPVSYGAGPDWEADDCTLSEFVRFFAIVNRAYGDPNCDAGGLAQSRLVSPWQRCGVTWKSVQYPELWTNGEAVLDGNVGALGARTEEALRRAANSLGVEIRR